MNDKWVSLPFVLERVKAEFRRLSPTGWQLLELVRWQGDRMLFQLKHGTPEQYRAEKQFYIELLELAEKDPICAPILIQHVQAVLDEESILYRAWQARFDKP